MELYSRQAGSRAELSISRRYLWIHASFAISLTWIQHFWPNGAFTPDANEALSASDLHVKSMQRRE